MLEGMTSLISSFGVESFKTCCRGEIERRQVWNVLEKLIVVDIGSVTKKEQKALLGKECIWKVYIVLSTPTWLYNVLHITLLSS